MEVPVLSFSCAQCRARLVTGQTMCRCGQVFSFPVPEFSESYNSMYWPPASASQPAAVNWWNDLSPAIKASAGGAVVLIIALIAVGGSVHQYQTMHARYAPGRPAMVASAVPAPVQVPTAPMAPSAPTPLILEAAPRYVPPLSRQGQTGQSQVTVIPQPTESNTVAASAPPPQVDVRAQATAATEDAVKVMLTGEMMVPNMGASEANWTTLESQVQSDRGIVSQLQGSISADQYAEDMRKIDQAGSSLAQNKQTWALAKAQSSIHFD